MNLRLIRIVLEEMSRTGETDLRRSDDESTVRAYVVKNRVGREFLRIDVFPKEDA